MLNILHFVFEYSKQLFLILNYSYFMAFFWSEDTEINRKEFILMLGKLLILIYLVVFVSAFFKQHSSDLADSIDY